MKTKLFFFLFPVITSFAILFSISYHIKTEKSAINNDTLCMQENPSETADTSNDTIYIHEANPLKVGNNGIVQLGDTCIIITAEDAEMLVSLLNQLREEQNKCDSILEQEQLLKSKKKK